MKSLFSFEISNKLVTNYFNNLKYSNLIIKNTNYLGNSKHSFKNSNQSSFSSESSAFPSTKLVKKVS